MRKMPHHIENQTNVKSVLEQGLDAELPAWEAVFRAYFADPAEVIPLHERRGFKTITLAGVEPAGIAADEAYNRLTENQRKLWLDLLFAISTEKSAIGASCHMLYIGEKKAE